MAQEERARRAKETKANLSRFHQVDSTAKEADEEVELVCALELRKRGMLKRLSWRELVHHPNASGICFGSVVSPGRVSELLAGMVSRVYGAKGSEPITKEVLERVGGGRGLAFTTYVTPELKYRGEWAREKQEAPCARLMMNEGEWKSLFERSGMHRQAYVDPPPADLDGHFFGWLFVCQFCNMGRTLSNAKFGGHRTLECPLMCQMVPGVCNLIDERGVSRTGTVPRPHKCCVRHMMGLIKSKGRAYNQRQRKVRRREKRNKMERSVPPPPEPINLLPFMRQRVEEERLQRLKEVASSSSSSSLQTSGFTPNKVQKRLLVLQFFVRI